MLMGSGTSTSQCCSSFTCTPRTTSLRSSIAPKITTRLLVSDSKGFEGQYIRFHSEKYNHQNEADRLAGAKFKIAPGLDPSLRDLTTKIVKIATWYGSVSEFVNVHSKPEYGVVNHALCAAIRKLLRVPLQLAD